MCSLPFITEPKAFTLAECGNAKIGVIKLIKKGFISVAEQQELDSVALKSIHYQLQYGELIVKIVNNKKVSYEEAEKVINKPTENLSIAGEFLADIKKLHEGHYALAHDDLFKIAVILKYRSLTNKQVEEFERLDSIEQQQFLLKIEPIDYKQEDIKQLPTQLYEEILEFVLGEQMGEEKADLGKRFSSEMNSSENLLMQEQQTGENCTGNFKESETNDLTT